MDKPASHWLAAYALALLGHAAALAALGPLMPPAAPSETRAPLWVRLDHASATPKTDAQPQPDPPHPPSQGEDTDSPLSAEVPETLSTPVTEVAPRPSISRAERLTAAAASAPAPKRSTEAHATARQAARPSVAAAAPTPAPRSTERSIAASPAAPPESAPLSARTQDGAPTSPASHKTRERPALVAYHSRLRNWLARYQRYPEMARRLRQQGRVEVALTLDTQGRLIDSRILASSGHALLDQEALSLLRRASPMPAPPSVPGAGPFNITVPIDFHLL